VTPGEPGVLPDVSANTYTKPAYPFSAVVSFVRKTLVVAEREVRRIRHDPTDILTRAVQPAIWLVVFGQVFTRAHAINTGNLRYIDFMAPGVLAQSVLFIAIFYGIAVIWERDMGIIQKYLVSPTPRSALVLGRALSAGARALPQAVIIYILALLVGVKMDYRPQILIAVLFTVILGAVIFAIFSMIIAALVKKRERFMGIGQILTMPLFFASNAIYPINLMPRWLQVVSHINPLTYEIDALRGLMLVGWHNVHPLGMDIGVLLGVVIVLVILGGKIYPRVVC
jgi:ABC-2 type transport system permease protein